MCDFAIAAQKLEKILRNWRLIDAKEVGLDDFFQFQKEVQTAGTG
jgi:hypothetical protein